MKTRSLADPVRYPAMTTAQIREAFLIDALFRPGELHQVYVDLDRAVVGMAAPLGSPVLLTADDRKMTILHLLICFLRISQLTLPMRGSVEMSIGARIRREVNKACQTEQTPSPAMT